MIELLGLNHKSAPIEVREKFVFCEEDIKRFVPILRENGIQGAVVISTCNRTEIYIEYNRTSAQPFSANDIFEDCLLKYRKADKSYSKYFYKKTHSEVVRHLFHVVSGLDSMALGEYQIVGQVKDAFSISEKNDLLSPVLNRLFNKAFEAGKKVRSNTCICRGAVSISYAGVELAGKILHNIEKQSVLLVGAGQTSELTLQNFMKKGCKDFTIVNRTYENAIELASKYNAKAEEIENLEDLLVNNNIVVTSTASKKPLITKEMLERVMEQRSFRPLFLLDLSVPRNVANDVVDVQNVNVYDIDNLNNIIEENFERRRGEICAAEEIIEELVIDFANWVHSRNLIPTFQYICKYFHGISKSELEVYLKDQKISDSPKASVYAEQITNKIIHNVINNVKSLTNNGKDHEKIQLVNQLFNQN
jgi:glutamyl-tRNA reductase